MVVCKKLIVKGKCHNGTKYGESFKSCECQ